MNGPLRFQVEIDCVGAAFEDSGELGRILHKLADRAQVQTIGVFDADGERHEETSFSNDGSWALQDVNGNRVGTAWLEEIE